jgi:hypothetical protein
VPIVVKSGNLNLLNPKGLSRSVMGLLYLFCVCEGVGIYIYTYIYKYIYVYMYLGGKVHSLGSDIIGHCERKSSYNVSKCIK